MPIDDGSSWASAKGALAVLRKDNKVSYDRTSQSLQKLIALIRADPKDSKYRCVNKSWGGLDNVAGRSIMLCMGYKEDGPSLTIQKAPPTQLMGRTLQILQDTSGVVTAKPRVSVVPGGIDVNSPVSRSATRAASRSPGGLGASPSSPLMARWDRELGKTTGGAGSPTRGTSAAMGGSMRSPSVGNSAVARSPSAGARARSTVAPGVGRSGGPITVSASRTKSKTVAQLPSSQAGGDLANRARKNLDGLKVGLQANSTFAPLPDRVRKVRDSSQASDIPLCPLSGSRHNATSLHQLQVNGMNKPTKTLCVLFWTRMGFSFDMKNHQRADGVPICEDACSPGGSKKALANLNAVAAQWNGGDCRFVAINVDDSPQQPAHLKPDTNWPNVEHYWTNTAGSSAFGIHAVPAMYIIKEGEIKCAWDGSRLKTVGRQIDGKPKPADWFVADLKQHC